MINIVIVGAGFGGLQTALKLEKKFKNNKNVALSLIDKRDYHLFTPNLFEVATAAEELVSIEQIKKSITLPLKKILQGKSINFIKGELKQVDPQKKLLVVNNKQINFDYLVLALGSQSDFFNIPGAQENALVLKDLPDALRMRNQIAFAMEAHRLDVSKKNLHLVVAGGGYTGVELVGELKGLIDFLAWKNQYPREKVTIEVIDGNNKLVAGFDDRLSLDAFYRLQEMGVQVRLSDRITGVDRNFISLASGEKLAYDVLFWTAGVKACTVHTSAGMDLDLKGRLHVNEFFQVTGHHNIFALGDIACVMGKNGRPMVASAQDAIDQARYLAYALPFVLKNKKPKRPFVGISHGFIVNVGGKWAIMSYAGIYSTGLFAYVMDKLAHVRYYISVVGLWQAIKCIIFQTEIYSRND